MRFEFATANRILFGVDSIRQLGDIAFKYGNTALVLTGPNPQRIQHVLDDITSQNLKHTLVHISTEPTIDMIIRVTETARKKPFQIVIGIGGGSVLDAGKAVAALLTNPGDLMDYLEVIGKGKPLVHIPLPYIAIPTTAGTGAEVTRNAVLKATDQKVKVSMRSPLMLPKIALIDPTLTYSMPPLVTASTGLDALTQLMESFVSARANPLTDAICREGLTRASQALLKAYKNSNDTAAREDMALAGLFGGLALANAGLGAVHGFAGPLGGMIDAPHGVICARLLPHVMAANVAALLSQTGPESARRFEEIAHIVTGNSSARAIDAVEWIGALCEQLQVPSLREFGLTKQDISAVVSKAQQTSSMKGNPIALTEQELTAILTASL
ncbi:MAG: iron-containing alcohol dehydrogenase [Sedimentisphaerales bacterium]|nr:iron-containing alcohol dehydrogenase [Sedimentisphaerales bacterium]